MAARLQVLICTTAERLGKINPDGLPELHSVEYLICCQNPEGLPAASCAISRCDIRTIFTPGTGLSNNRNSAFDTATAPYLYIADDDLTINADGLCEIIRRFDSDPELGLLTLRSKRPEATVYPPEGYDIRQPYRFYEPVSFEIAVRSKDIKEKQIRFSPLAGIGAPYLIAGEENLFIYHAIDSGLKARHAAVTVAEHPGMTTGFRLAGTPELLRTKAAVNRIIRGSAATLLRLPLMAWREPAPFFNALTFLLKGFIYAGRHRDEL